MSLKKMKPETAERITRFIRDLWAAEFDSTQIATITRLASKAVPESEIVELLHADQDRRHAERTGRAS